MGKKNTIFLFLGCLALIIAAILLTALIDFSKSGDKNTDVRARAAKNDMMVFHGKIASYDEAASIVIIDNVAFEDTKGNSLGTWSVTYPATFNPSSVPMGTNVRIQASPATFKIADKTITATEISKL